MKRCNTALLALAVAILALWLTPIQAAGSPWTAWLYEDTIGRMTLVNDEGATLQQFQLPPGLSATFSRQAAVSSDGALVAYSTIDSSGTYLNIYDLVMHTPVYTVAMPLNATTSLEFTGTRYAFSDGNSTFAFAYAHESVGWEIIVVDIVTLSHFSLQASSPLGSSLPSGNGFMLPVVEYNRNLEVKFFLIPLGTEGAPQYDAYTWNLGSSTISMNNAYVTVDTDTFFPTNEVISTISDSGFPNNADPISGFPVSNTLQVFDPAINSRYVVTSLPGIYNPRFIQNGKRVAVTQYITSADGSTTTQSLLILERNGALSGSVAGAPTNNITSAAGILNGFIFTAGRGGEAGGTTLYTVETRLSSPSYTAVSTWNSSLGANARIVWVSDNVTSSAGPFIPWGQISPSSSPVVPTAAPVSGGTLIASGQASVQTTDGDVLNVRSGPGRSYSRLGTVGNGTIVTLLEGPRSNEGLNWWRVRLPNGTEGWVVDFADGVQTLLPR